MAASAIDWDTILGRLKESLEQTPLPSVSAIALEEDDPYRVLVSTVLSLRTRDEVTLQASARLLARAGTPAALAGLSIKTIEKLIYPVGFYHTKAKNLKEIGAILVREYGGKVPGNEERLLALPGVGRKTANLVLNLGFGINAICVDTHVHRISNRTGWVATHTPAETEAALMKILPEKHWIEINEWLVRFGQQLCRPIAPFCSRCPITDHCRRVGVLQAR